MKHVQRHQLISGAWLGLPGTCLTVACVMVYSTGEPGYSQWSAVTGETPVYSAPFQCCVRTRTHTKTHVSPACPFFSQAGVPHRRPCCRCDHRVRSLQVKFFLGALPYMPAYMASSTMDGKRKSTFLAKFWHSLTVEAIILDWTYILDNFSWCLSI